MALERLKAFLDDPGERIGKYELLREIAQGGMGVVYLAYDPDLRRSVALKVVRPQDAPRLRREAAAAASLRHPNIVTVHEVGAHWIAMDYIEGETLARKMPSLSLAERVGVLETVARAVDFAHGHGVIHRDLKPQNILLDPHGRVVLTDFGLAKMAGGEDLTQTGSVAGTPHYMAPEQVQGRSTGPAADIWSLGVMVYECASGGLPFPGETPLEIYDQIVRRDPRPLEGPLGTIALCALEKDPARRYGSARSLADDLGRVVAGEAIGARRSLRRYRKSLLGASALLLLLGAFGILRLERAGELLPGRSAGETSLGRWQKREEEYSRALLGDPGSTENLLGRSEIRQARGDDGRDRGRNPFPDYAAAEEDLTRALRISPGHKEALFRRGRVRTQRAVYKVKYGIDPLEDCAGAEADLSQAIDYPGARTWRGNVRFHRGVWREKTGKDPGPDYAEAEADLTPAPDADALARRGRVRAYRKDFRGAEADFAQSIQANDQSVWAWMWRGNARMSAGDFTGAEADLSRAVAVNPELAEAWEQRGRARLKRGQSGDGGRAASDFRQAISLNPSLLPLLEELLRESERPPGP
jgi:tetratricopeptide (TPR) repeat protein/predicted Ser/Thr protein kinase